MDGWGCDWGQHVFSLLYVLSNNQPEQDEARWDVVKRVRLTTHTTQSPSLSSLSEPKSMNRKTACGMSFLLPEKDSVTKG